MAWPTFYVVCFLLGFTLSMLSLLGGTGRFHAHVPRAFHLPGHLPLPHGAMGRGSTTIRPATQPALPGVNAAGGQLHLGAGQGAQTSIFNFFSAMAFLAWFGGTGYILTTYSSLFALLTLAVATTAGVAGGGIVFLFFAKVLVAHERVLDPADYNLIGVLGRISAPIREGGTGEIIFSQAGGACAVREARTPKRFRTAPKS